MRLPVPACNPEGVYHCIFKCMQSKGWLYDIVANGRNSLDVDKFDYLPRDGFYTGSKVGADFHRIIMTSKACALLHHAPCFKEVILA